jgi:hypothetical protein
MGRLVLARSARIARWGALRVVLAVASLLFVSGFLLMACPREAQATSADSNTYYAEVKYYDGIQMKYIVRHGIDEYWTPIDETIAIMATKAAVWNFTDQTFALLSTSLNPDPANPTAEQKARYELMVALMKHLASVNPGGVFSLADGDTATITGLPLGQYRVSERESADGYTTVSQLDSNAAVEGSAADVPLTLQSPSRAVGFTNTIVPQTPNTPVTPVVPNTPGNTTELPPTGDHGARTGILALLLALGGLCLGGLGLAARRSKGAQHVVSPSPRM